MPFDNAPINEFRKAWSSVRSFVRLPHRGLLADNNESMAADEAGQTTATHASPPALSVTLAKEGVTTAVPQHAPSQECCQMAYCPLRIYDIQLENRLHLSPL